MSTLFFTGFPGFLGAELLPRILSRSPESRAACLVQTKYASLARLRAQEIERTYPALAGRIDILEGDITQPALGLGKAAGVRDTVAEIFHLAAIYDLGVGRDIGMRVNVEGTRRMLEFAAGCNALQRFQYVSTCYVSGTHSGAFSEEDLDCGQGFHNFYEETKFLAEVEVRKYMREGLPATIYRPAIVVGDSGTGATQKYDGPYSIIRFLLRQPRVAILPTILGDSSATQVNLVPRDFVLDAFTFLSGHPEAKNRVFHLADPNPLTVEELLREVARATARSVVRVPVPLSAAKFLLARVPGMRYLIDIPSDTLDYFVHKGRYSTKGTQPMLAAAGIRCPRFSEYVDRLVEFVRAHPEIGSAAMA